jgi:hypothetical protein
MECRKKMKEAGKGIRPIAVSPKVDTGENGLLSVAQTAKIFSDAAWELLFYH